MQTIDLRNLDPDDIQIANNIEIVVKDSNGDPVILQMTVQVFREIDQKIHKHVYPHYHGYVPAGEAVCGPMGDRTLDEGEL